MLPYKEKIVCYNDIEILNRGLLKRYTVCFFARYFKY